MLKNKLKVTCIVTFSLLLVQNISFSQTTRNVEIQIKTSRGLAADGINVYIADGYACFSGVTNSQGSVQFELVGYELLVMAADQKNKKRFGIVSYPPNYSANVYHLTIPEYPSSQRDAGQQLDNFLETLALYHDIQTLSNNWPNSATALNSNIQGTLGVPGVFSVSPIPRRMENGKLGLHISGILVEHIMRLSSIIPGRQTNYVGQI
jgi:hypothetical protein